MMDQTKIYEALNTLKDSVFEEMVQAGKEGVTVSRITERLNLNVFPWSKHSVGSNYLVWALLAILEKEGKISATKTQGRDTRIFAKWVE